MSKTPLLNGGSAETNTTMIVDRRIKIQPSIDLSHSLPGWELR